MISVSSLVRALPSIRSYSTKRTFQPVSHVIFDMDGLLLNTEIYYKASIATVISTFGKEYSPELRLKVLGTKEQDTAKIIVETLKLPVTPQEFAVKAKIEQAKLMPNATLMPGAERLIRHLSKNKVPIAIATSSGEESVLIKTAKHLELFKCFNHMVKGSSDPEVKNGKPAPDIFLTAARRFPNPPSADKCLVFEDAPNGVTGAIKAGMQCVMVPEDYIPPEMTTHATVVIKNLLEFKPEEFGLPPFEDS